MVFTNGSGATAAKAGSIAKQASPADASQPAISLGLIRPVGLLRLSAKPASPKIKPHQSASTGRASAWILSPLSPSHTGLSKRVSKSARTSSRCRRTSALCGTASTRFERAQRKPRGRARSQSTRKRQIFSWLKPKQSKSKTSYASSSPTNTPAH